MITKRSSRKVKVNKEEISFKFRKYVPYEETFKYIILKKIYYKTFQFIFKKKSINFLEFKKIYLIIMEKEIELNKKRLLKKEEHYNKIRNSLLKEIETHFKTILELDITESIYQFSNFKINLIEYLKKRYNEIKEEYKKNIVNLNFEEMEYITFKQDFISIQSIQNNKFNLIITCPLEINDKLANKNCIIGTLLRFCYTDLSKQLKLDFNELIVYFPLNKKRKVYTIYNIFNTFQDIDWLKILYVFKEKLTITTNNNKKCEFCENSLMCFNNKEIEKTKEEAVEKELLRII